MDGDWRGERGDAVALNADSSVTAKEMMKYFVSMAEGFGDCLAIFQELRACYICR